jgi:O-antigen/teichoic acid export membrane protein
LRRLRNKIARLGPRLRGSDVFKGGATALAIKFAGAILNFAMLALLSRQIDPDAFGSFAIIFSALGFLAALAPCGQEVLISRSWGEYVSSNRPGLARGVLTFGIQVVCTAVLLAATAVAIIWPQFDRTLSIPLMFAACSFLIAQALMHFSGQFSRVAAGVLIGDGPREIIWRGIVVTVILAHLAMGAAFSATEFFFVAATGLVLGIIVQIRKVSRFVPDAVKRTRPQRDVSSWIPCSFKMWLSALSDIAAQYLEVVVVGLFLGPAVAGFYFVATRITNVFAMMAAGTSMYAGSVISKLYYSDAKAELQGILSSLALMSAILVAGGLLSVVVAGKLMLWLFGPAYVSAYPSLIVLAVGAAVAALAGPAGHLLILTGREGVYPVIMGAGLALRFLLFATLGPAYGLLGAALAWSVSAIAMALALTIASRRLVGLDPSPGAALAHWPSPSVRLEGSEP